MNKQNLAVLVTESNLREPQKEAKSHLSPVDDCNKRIQRRNRCLKAGVITYNDRHFTIECMIRDITDGGARVKCLESVSVPDTFQLISELDGFIAECEVVWRNGKEIGVKFVSEMVAMPPERIQNVQPAVPEKRSILRKPLPKS